MNRIRKKENFKKYDNQISVILTLFMILFTIPVFSFGAENLECQFRDNHCLVGETALLYANNHFTDSSGRVLSSNVAVTQDSNYNKVLCCKSEFGNINISFINKSETCIGGDELMYFTDKNNARVRFIEYDKYRNIPLHSFDINDYKYKSCVYNPDGFNFFDIVVSDRNLELLGYTCLYKVSNIENGLVSDCSAKFNGDNTYKYTVWGRLWEDINSIKCSLQCTSKLDGRVYVMCGKKIKECQGVPLSCNGALLGSWVPELDVNGNPTGREILCEPPWNKVKTQLFTNETININVTETCKNVISKSYPVIIENQKVNMLIYMCQN